MALLDRVRAGADVTGEADDPNTRKQRQERSGLLLRVRGATADVDADSGLDLAEVEVVGRQATRVLREDVQVAVRELLRDRATTPDLDDLRSLIGLVLEEAISRTGELISVPERTKIVETIAQDMVGLGPLDELMADPEVHEIMVCAADKVYVERRQGMQRSSVVFESEAHLMQVIDRIVTRIGRRIDELSPMVDARLADGSRVHIVIPPLALTGPTITIRRFAQIALRADDLVETGTCTADMLAFLRACVLARRNIAITGGGGSGKTTTLNVLSGFIPEEERIVTIEDAAELQLDQVHVVPLETRPANVEGRGQVTIRDLVINALRMRPDRIVIGECRGGEALDMLQAMNTGHDGSITTLHANSAKDALTRLETMVLMAGTVLPSRAIREQIGAAISIVVHQARMRDGSRKITGITEVTGCVDGTVRHQEIFRFNQTGIASDRSVKGRHLPTGVVPKCLDDLAASGQALPTHMFKTRRGGRTNV